MPAKLGKTKKYAGLASTVKGAAIAPPKKLSPQAVVDAFKAFGFADRQKPGDQMYWENQPEESMSDMLEELKSRRDTEEESSMAAKEAEEAALAGQPKMLTSDDMRKLFAEYGLPMPDPKWAEENLPRNEEELRKLLMVHRQLHNDGMKQAGDAQIKTMASKMMPKEMPMAGRAAPTRGMPAGAMGGMGGPGETTNVVLSGQGLIRFDGSDAVYYVDPEMKVIRPIIGNADETIRTLFGDRAEEVMNRITTVPPSALSVGSSLSGYKNLGTAYGIKEDGTMPKVDFSPAAISARYGNSINKDAELGAYTILDGFIDVMYNTDSGVDKGFLDSIKTNKDLLSFYINALAYGDYTPSDIYSDIKRRELVKAGNSSMDEVGIIDPSKKRGQYSSTAAGRMASTYPELAPPQRIGSMDSSLLNFDVFNLPDEAFKTLVPALDITSQSFKDEMAKVKSAYHDILDQQINASTEQQKSIADYNWDQFKTKLERTYGVKLAGNALAAWKQIESLGTSAARGNLYNSGIHNEAIDDYLKTVRQGDSQVRTEKMEESESKEMTYYTSYATPEQIKEFVAKNPEKAKAWGLVPSAETLNAYSLFNLKQRYPDLSDEEIQRYRDSIIDENGHYRSTLYQKRAESLASNAVSRRDFQSTTAMNQNMRDEEKAASEFTKSDSPFIRADSTASTAPDTSTETSTKKDPNPYTFKRNGSLIDVYQNGVKIMTTNEKGASTYMGEDSVIEDAATPAKVPASTGSALGIPPSVSETIKSAVSGTGTKPKTGAQTGTGTQTGVKPVVPTGTPTTPEYKTVGDMFRSGTTSFSSSIASSTPPVAKTPILPKSSGLSYSSTGNVSGLAQQGTQTYGVQAPTAPTLSFWDRIKAGVSSVLNPPK